MTYLEELKEEEYYNTISAVDGEINKKLRNEEKIALLYCGSNRSKLSTQFFVHVPVCLDATGHLCAGYRKPTKDEMATVVKVVESFSQKAEIVDEEHVNILHNPWLIRSETKKEFRQEQIKFWLKTFEIVIKEAVGRYKHSATRLQPSAECGLVVTIFPGGCREKIRVYAHCLGEELPVVELRITDNTTDKLLIAEIYEAYEKDLKQKLQSHNDLIYDYLIFCTKE